MDSRPSEPYRSIQRRVFWRDRRWLEAHRAGATYERDYVPGEFWSEEHFRHPSGVERVRVWGRKIRYRCPLPTGGPIVTDAEDSANWMWLDGPPDEDDEEELGELPPPPPPAWVPRRGLPLSVWPRIAWLGAEQLPPEGVDALREALAPVLDDVVATTDVGFVLDAHPTLRGWESWSCVILPHGQTGEDATERSDALSLPGGWEVVDVRMRDPLPQVIVTAAHSVQSYVLPVVWAETGIGVWPACPIHGGHPLWPDLDQGVAVWACPKGTLRVPIGRLERPLGNGR